MFYKKYKFSQSGDWKEFREWQQRSVGEAARLASILAELYINSIATLTPSGDLVVTIGDIAERGPQWDQLISVLPLLGQLPIGAIIIKLGNREIKLPKALARDLEALGTKERKVLLERAAAAKTNDEAQATIKRGITETLDPEHHIATNKNWVSTLRGGPWSPRLEALFKKAGMTLDDAENKIRFLGHKAPHPESYHQVIYDRLTRAVKGLTGEAYKRELLKELDRVGQEIRTPGTRLNRLLTD